MEHVYLRRPTDKPEIEKYIDRFQSYTDQELINAYNGQKAIYGVHQQVLYLIALDIVFKERFYGGEFQDLLIDIVFGLECCDGFNSPDSCCNAAF